MSEKNIIHILTILEVIEKIKIYTKDFKDADTFVDAKDQLYYHSVTSILLTIGEESKKIDSFLKEKYHHIKWKQLGDMRNILAQDYRGVDYQIVWDVVQTKLSTLKTALVDMLIKHFRNSHILLKNLDTKYYRHIKYLKEELKND